MKNSQSAKGLSRRNALRIGAGTAASLALGGCSNLGKRIMSAQRKAPRLRKPGEKLNIGVIGVGGKGWSNWEPMFKMGENIVALCDVDQNPVEHAMAIVKERNPDVKAFNDYRKMLDTCKNLDVVLVSTPDHMHAPAAIRAINCGCHVYVEKPLVRTLWEAHSFKKAAEANGVVTQMGNQGSGDDGFRRNVEIIRSGLLGNVREVHVWSKSPLWPQGFTCPAGDDPIPEKFNWDSWLGTAEERPYKEGVYHPFKWRGFHDFGGGALGDMGCHMLNLPFRGLELDEVLSAECLEINDKNNDTYPSSSVVKLQYAARKGMPAVDFFWRDGLIKPPAEIMPQVVATLGEVPKTGSLMIGDKGIMISTGDYGETAYVALKGEKKIRSTSKHEAVTIIPQTMKRCVIEEKTELCKEERLVQRNGEWKMIKMGISHSRANHRAEFIHACKGEGSCASDIGVSIPMMEGVLVGCIAQQVPGLLKWSSRKQSFKNNRAANALVKPHIRKGWEY